MDEKTREELLSTFEQARFRKELPALSEALIQGRLDVAQALIDLGANVNEYAKRPAAERGMAPIHFADSPEAVKLLAKAGAEVNAPYKEVDHAWGMRGETLLHSLALTGKPKDLPTIDALLEAGADPGLPFSGEYKYSRDSNLAMKDRIVRGDVNVTTRITLLREKGKWADRDLDELLSSPVQAKNQDKTAEKQTAPVQEKPEGKTVETLVNSIEYDGQPEMAKRLAPRVDPDHSIGSSQSPIELAKDDSFVSWLNLRMKTAEWDSYERGSEEFFGIENDLEKLSKADPNLARELWKENTPPGMKLPFYLDPTAEQEVNGPRPIGDDREAGADKGAQQGPKRAAGDAEKEEGYKVPEAIKRRYLEAENRFFFRDEKNKLAFEDRGRKMTTEHNDPDVAKSLVEIAEAKGWSKIKVAGHEDFKREVWLQAQLKGIEVTGYKAKDVDLARLEELKQARMKNSVERDDSREQTKGKTADKVPDEEKAYGAPAYNKAENFRGKLMEHGRANFDFNEKNDQSYYVKIETENGVRMHWGVDLGRAMENAPAKIGDLIELERLGKRPVTVQEKQFDEQGKFVGHKPVETERIEWSVNGVDMSKNVSKAAEVVVNGSSGKTVLLDKEQPKPVEPKRDPAPVALAKTAELKPEAQQETKAPGKAKAPALTGDYKVAAQVLEKLLKAEGVNPQVLKRANAKAAEMLQGMAVAGKPAPGVRVYDRKAERERPREKVQTKTKDQQQERSR